MLEIFKPIFLVILFTTTLFASSSKLYFENNKVYNAQTALLFLEAKNIKNPKLTFDKLNINFVKHKNENKYFAFIPVDYYKEAKKYRVIISYIKNSKKVFKGINLFVKSKDYKSEVIKVKKSKVVLNTKSQSRASKEYKEAMKIYNTISNDFTNSKFIYPLNTAITSNFGTKRVYNNTIKSYHSGTDFKAKTPLKIKACANGVVRLVKNRFYAGNSVVIDHGYGVYSGYYHLSKMSVKPNQVIKKGDVIGLSGKTGRVTGPHLHFSFRVHGVQVDPLQFIDTANKI